MKRILSFIAIISCVLSLLAIPTFFTGCNSQESCTCYDISCTLNGNVLVGKMKIDFVNQTETTFDSLLFNLYGNAFRKDAKYSPISSQYEYKAYYNGKNYGNMMIDKVYGKTDLAFNIIGEDQNILEVVLDSELFPNERVEVTIEYTLTLAEIVARTGVNNKTINLGNFYPILCAIENGEFYQCVYYSKGDPFYSDMANYVVSITADSEYVVASSGEIVSKKENEGYLTSTYKLDNCRSFAMVLSKNFESIVDNCCGVQITYYFYDDEKPEKALAISKEGIATFTELYGDYPYTTLKVVQTPFIEGGMEYSGLVYISDAEKDMSYLEVIVHEIAHGYFQTAVGNNEVECAFLDEGLAEYSVILFYERNEKYNYTYNDLIAQSIKSYKLYVDVYDKLYNNVNTSMVRNLKDFDSNYEYINIVYIKPCIMYDMIRKTVGEEKFFSSLKRYYQENKNKIANEDSLIEAFRYCARDIEGIFNTFYSGKEII